jgi:hypothetical protein
MTLYRYRMARARSEASMALLFALATIALLSVLILAFLSRAQINRQIAFSSTNQIKADLFSRSALHILVGEIREEIRNGSTAQNGGNANYPIIYQPNTNADVTMKPCGLDGTGSVTLINVSTNGAGIYPAEGTIAAGRALGSSYAISSPSLNGRYVSAASWFGVDGPQLGAQTALPTWVFVTRQNGIDVPALANAVSPASADYVIGRFAYTVYDLGGLLNANVAGAPSSDTTNALFKPSQAYADLTQIPGIASSANSDALVAWRQSADDTSASAYTNYLQTYGQTAGFLSTHQGDNAFLSRKDLINFAQQGLGVSATSLPYLTHFSRSLNAPSWGPVANSSAMGGNGTYPYNSNANTTGSANRFLPNVRIATTGTLTHYSDAGATTTYAVTAGAPLLQRRFSLARLAWLTSSGPATGITAAAIRSCFGLQWVNTPTTGPDGLYVAGGYGWAYVGSAGTGSTTLSSIETLDQVAAENREPNFFELLQAGILSGVLGVNAQGYQASTTPVTAFPYAAQSSAFLHTLTIGANLIDQYKADSYPTILIGNWNGNADMVSGSKALPMIAGYMDLAGADTANGNATSLAVYLTVNLWNPYVLPGTSSAGTVPQIRVHVEGGFAQFDAWNTTNNGSPNYALTNMQATEDGWAQINPANYGNYGTLSPVTAASVSSQSSWSTLPAVQGGTLEAFKFPDVPINNTPAAVSNAVNVNGIGVSYLRNQLGTKANPFNIVAEYQTPAGNWVPYSYLDGINDTNTWRTAPTPPKSGVLGTLGAVHWLNGGYVNSATLTPVLSTFTSTQGGVGPFDYKIDPRSTRFNELQWSGTPSPATQAIPFLSLSFLTADSLGAGSGSPSEQYVPLLFSATENQGATPFLSPASLAFNNGGTTGGHNETTTYTDLDGVRRLADYGLFAGDTWASTPYGAATGSATQAGVNSPIILNRPFRSVGELGYTFIDLPWRSINFCDHNNAFGGLLDIFSLTDEPLLTDDRVNLNAPQSLIMQSLLSGSAQNADGTSTLTSPSGIATAYNTYAYSSANTPSTNLPYTPAQLTDFLYAQGTANGLDSVKAHREAVVRALADTTQTRTWNVLIDVVAQVGHYPGSAKTLNDFLVEGEKRYWLSIAIDRYTGQVIDQTLEPVNE